MTRYAIFDTLEAALAYIAECDALLGLPKPGNPPAEYPEGWTLTWAEPRKHPTEDRWTVICCPSCGHGGMVVVDELSADWTAELSPAP